MHVASMSTGCNKIVTFIICYNAVTRCTKSVEFNIRVASCQQAIKNLSTIKVRINSAKNPLDKLLEQHWNKFAALKFVATFAFLRG